MVWDEGIKETRNNPHHHASACGLQPFADLNAVRGTIITTGDVSRGTAQAAFERGAAPITLIDGEKLLDLLIQTIQVAQGNRDVILCERGIRTYETATRNTLDVAAIPVLKAETHLPVIVDPSHAGGRAELVAPLAFAAVAAGADGLIVEVHPSPERALSDGDQSLTLDAFADMMRTLRAFAEAAGRSLPAAREAATSVAA